VFILSLSDGQSNPFKEAVYRFHCAWQEVHFTGAKTLENFCRCAAIVYTGCLCLICLEKRSMLRLQNGLLGMAVDAQTGGRISEFSYQGKNSLYEGEPVWGSTYWPSPQSSWGWPPPAVLDEQPYAIVKESSSEIVLLSAVCPKTHLQVQKRFVARGHGIAVEYTHTNRSQGVLSLAPWEITRVGGGVTLFIGQSTPIVRSSLAISNDGNCWWHEYRVENQRGENQKAFASGSDGWLANIYNGLVLLKRFTKVPRHCEAPGEAEIEIYAHGDVAHPYVEVEQQGQYQTIAAGQSNSWTVQWDLLPLPAELMHPLQPAELADWIQSALHAFEH
jgi:Domain of unknown function (DUF4380)